MNGRVTTAYEISQDVCGRLGYTDSYFRVINLGVRLNSQRLHSSSLLSSSSFIVFVRPATSQGPGLEENANVAPGPKRLL